MLADELDYVLGVDTHRDEHVAAVVTRPPVLLSPEAGGARERARLPQLLRGSPSSTRPAARAWAIEGTGSYGAGLARYLAAHGETRARGQPHTASRAAAARQRRRARRGQDSAGRTRQRRRSRSRAGERREALRLLLVARRSAVDVRREALTQLRAVIVTAPNRSATSCARCRSGSCSTAAAASAAPAQPQPTSSRPGSCCAASPAASKRRPVEAAELEREILAHVAHSRRRCSTSPASARSSPPN